MRLFFVAVILGVAVSQVRLFKHLSRVGLPRIGKVALGIESVALVVLFVTMFFRLDFDEIIGSEMNLIQIGLLVVWVVCLLVRFTTTPRTVPKK